MRKFMIALCALFAAACSGAEEIGPDGGAGPYAPVIASASRIEKDAALDPMRKPEQVLEFIAAEPGMTIFEMEAGDGYYTELLSAAVGPGGEIVMQSPPSFDTFLAEGIKERLAGGRLPNVRLSKTRFDMLDAEDASADMVTWMLGPHELFFTPADGGFLGSVEGTYAEIFRILKPGGTVIILDHSAGAGAPPETGGMLHRIDPAVVKGQLADAGFEFVAESDILRNPNDDYEMSVFDARIRRKTDRFLLKYKKPE